MKIEERWLNQFLLNLAEVSEWVTYHQFREFGVPVHEVESTIRRGKEEGWIEADPIPGSEGKSTYRCRITRAGRRNAEAGMNVTSAFRRIGGFIGGLLTSICRAVLVDVTLKASGHGATTGKAPAPECLREQYPGDRRLP